MIRTRAVQLGIIETILVFNEFVKYSIGDFQSQVQLISVISLVSKGFQTLILKKLRFPISNINNEKQIKKFIYFLDKGINLKARWITSNGLNRILLETPEILKRIIHFNHDDDFEQFGDILSETPNIEYLHINHFDNVIDLQRLFNQVPLLQQLKIHHHEKSMNVAQLEIGDLVQCYLNSSAGKLDSFEIYHRFNKPSQYPLIKNIQELHKMTSLREMFIIRVTVDYLNVLSLVSLLYNIEKLTIVGLNIVNLPDETVDYNQEIFQILSSNKTIKILNYDSLHDIKESIVINYLDSNNTIQYLQLKNLNIDTTTQPTPKNAIIKNRTVKSVPQGFLKYWSDSSKITDIELDYFDDILYSTIVTNHLSTLQTLSVWVSTTTEISALIRLNQPTLTQLTLNIATPILMDPIFTALGENSSLTSLSIPGTSSEFKFNYLANYLESNPNVKYLSLGYITDWDPYRFSMALMKNTHLLDFRVDHVTLNPNSVEGDLVRLLIENHTIVHLDIPGYKSGYNREWKQLTHALSKNSTLKSIRTQLSGKYVDKQFSDAFIKKIPYNHTKTIYR
ncbi:hypothetical protein DLAC_02122 [Tieghemostelium lacteum]|uniref:Uncharacterized protein n=1 Tax=Tieghemostelium lacteum TaxID=361077 RepID=A0A152A4M8_TIELA|nr:hypothetical protein DLAC_02122 [Tieghemostelium lacteum]|eukprot:KYR01035.1 hypothetical protein DLAC_02122 [Tieghemostelium lacteum]